MEFEIKFNDFSDEIIQQMLENVAAANEAVGLQMETYVTANAPVGTPASTSIENYHGGALKKSITHKVIDDTVYVGTNMKAANGAPYPVYVELGTGIYADGGKGRQSPWTWRDKNGKFHYTHGIQPTHFMRNALTSADHIEKFKDIYEKYLKKG